MFANLIILKKSFTYLQSSQVKTGVARAERPPFVNIAVCAVTSQTLKPKGECGKVSSDASARHQNVKRPGSDSNISLEREAHVVLAPKSDNVNKAVNERGLLLDIGSPASVEKVVNSCDSENVVSPDVGSPSCSEVQNKHNEHLEDQTCALSESKCWCPIQVRIFAGLINRLQSNGQLTSQSSIKVHRTAAPPLK